MPSGPSEEATGADDSNPERNSVPSNPFGLLWIRRQRQMVCAVEKEEEEETPAGGGERAEETGRTGAEDEWQLKRTETIEESSGCGKFSHFDPDMRPVTMPASVSIQHHVITYCT
ncbi:hypothetical protein NDU88_003983 [Pleurodeles waltl]|uniref:Uncharacterized protein n=1 Tax=Pleurodeles waltl TaxID=8319 RepID=A0AAV7UDM8_PLEWA|nr:hypothetical protein NDU88_003983 [Pleurodeles waltl]